MPARPIAKARVRDQSTPARWSWSRPSAQSEVAILLQPPVQIDPSAERPEAVVGDDHQQVILRRQRATVLPTRSSMRR